MNILDFTNDSETAHVDFNVNDDLKLKIFVLNYK